MEPFGQLNQLIFFEKNNKRYIVLECQRKFWGLPFIFVLLVLLGGFIQIKITLSEILLLIIPVTIGIFIWMLIYRTKVIIMKDKATNSITVSKQLMRDKKQPIIFTPEEKIRIVLYNRRVLFNFYKKYYLAIESNKKKELLVPSFFFLAFEIFYIGLLGKDEITEIASYLNLPYSPEPRAWKDAFGSKSEFELR